MLVRWGDDDISFVITTLSGTPFSIAKEIEATWMLKPETLLAQDIRAGRSFGSFYARVGTKCNCNFCKSQNF